MTRRKFSREFKTEAVRLVTERGVAVAQAAVDIRAQTAPRARSERFMVCYCPPIG